MTSPTSPADSTSRTLKHASLFVLVIQNALLALCTRYVRTRPGDMFLSTVAVFITELVKLLTCILIIAHKEHYAVAPSIRVLSLYLFDRWRDTAKVCVPSLIYMIQNNLLYVAASNLEAATFQVTYQLKILTTALLSVLFLHKSLTRLQWTSLLVLVAGVALVQVSGAQDSRGTQALPHTAADTDTPAGAGAVHTQSRVVGLSSALLACLLSGAAGVYFEWILKMAPGSAQTSLWMRNIQLSVVSVPLALLAALCTDAPTVRSHGLFVGFDAAVGFVVVLNALGGLLVAVVVKYADNILKGFATSLAIVLSACVSVWLFEFVPNAAFCSGVCLVLLAVFMYGYRPPAAPHLAAGERRV